MYHTNIYIEKKKINEFSQNENLSSYADILNLFVEAKQFRCKKNKKNNNRRKIVHTITGNRIYMSSYLIKEKYDRKKKLFSYLLHERKLLRSIFISFT